VDQLEAKSDALGPFLPIHNMVFELRIQVAGFLGCVPHVDLRFHLPSNVKDGWTRESAFFNCSCKCTIESNPGPKLGKLQFKTYGDARFVLSTGPKVDEGKY
jgi:hypothetical protein